MNNNKISLNRQIFRIFRTNRGQKAHIENRILDTFKGVRGKKS